MACRGTDYCKATGAIYCCQKSMLTCFFNRREVDITENEHGTVIEVDRLPRNK